MPVGTIYVSGKMRGVPKFNFPAFIAAATSLRSKGWTVISPAEHDLAEGFDPAKGDTADFYRDALRWDFRQIIEHCDALYMLRGWETSEGARAEWTVASALGLALYYQSRK